MLRTRIAACMEHSLRLGLFGCVDPCAVSRPEPTGVAFCSKTPPCSSLNGSAGGSQICFMRIVTATFNSRGPPGHIRNWDPCHSLFLRYFTPFCRNPVQLILQWNSATPPSYGLHTRCMVCSQTPLCVQTSRRCSQPQSSRRLQKCTHSTTCTSCSHIEPLLYRRHIIPNSAPLRERNSFLQGIVVLLQICLNCWLCS